MMILDSVVGELYIVNGQRQSVAHFTGAFTAPRRSARGRQDDTLFILIDPSGPHAVVPDLIQRTQQAYWQVTGSVTAGLRAAIEAGNAWLVDQNHTAVAQTRAGVTCAVLRGSEIFIAQAGPSSAFVAHQGSIERFPRGGEGSQLPALGIARAVEVRFSHAELQPGDTLLLSDAGFPTRMPLEAVTSSIVYVGVEAALDNLTRLSGGESLIAMIIEVSAATPAAATPAAAAPAVEAKPTPRSAAPVAPPAAPKTPSRTSARPSSPAAPKEKPAPSAGEWAGALKQGVGRGLGSLGTGAKAMAQRALPDRPAPPRRRSVRGPSAIEHNVPLMLALAIGIPLIIAILVTAVYLDRSTTAQVDTLLNEARQSIQEADTSVSAQVKRERWQIALAKIAQALALDPANQPAIETRTQVQTQIDRIDNTVRVSPALLYDFNKTGRRRLALSDIYLFVLDQTAGSVDRLTLTSDGGSIEGTGPAQVLASGTTVVDRLVSDLIDMAWVDAGGARQKSALIMLERGGLVEYDLAFGLETIPFANTTPEGAQRLDAFDGNLYVLDVGGRQVWRYAPSDDGGYSGQADPYFASSPAGIENAIDMAIDGSIYLLEASGTVHKYFAREEVAFALTGLPTPITKPVAIAVDPVRAPGESGVYIADLDGARVLHFTPEGQFVRQIRSTGGEFDAIEDIWVDEGGNRLYTVSGGRVYSAALAAAVTP